MLLKNKQSFLLVIAFFCLWYTANLRQFNPKPIVQVSEQLRQINYNPTAIDFISLGQRRLLASLFWVQTLMDGDLEHYKKSDLGSWMYLRFDLITSLDPHFYEAYLWGGQYLSIVKDDILGADKIYNKGLSHFPFDIDLNFNAGFNRFFEMGDQKSALPYFERVIENPSGLKKYPHLLSLVEKIKKQEGVSVKDIISNLEDRLEYTKDERMKKYISKVIYAARATFDLDCLNSLPIKNTCHTKDYYGNPYIKENGGYVAALKFTPFKIYRNQK